MMSRLEKLKAWGVDVTPRTVNGVTYYVNESQIQVCNKLNKLPLGYGWICQDCIDNDYCKASKARLEEAKNSE